MRVVKYWHKLPRQVVEVVVYQSLEILRTKPDKVRSNLI